MESAFRWLSMKFDVIPVKTFHVGRAATPKNCPQTTRRCFPRSSALGNALRSVRSLTPRGEILERVKGIEPSSSLRHAVSQVMAAQSHHFM